jgi:hypothetical protein
MLWLIVFVCVLLAVAARQSSSFRAARRLGELREERMALEARRAELVPLAERTLGLHEPSDSEFTLLPITPSPSVRP